MWLSNSSIGRKVVMSVTGIALVLFLTFHMAMNLVALFSGDGVQHGLWVPRCQLVCAGSYCRTGCLVCNSHHLRFLADDAEPCKARGHERYAVTDKTENCGMGISKHVGTGYHCNLGLGLHFKLLVQNAVPWNAQHGQPDDGWSSCSRRCLSSCRLL